MRLQVVASVGAAGYFLLNYENAEGKEHVFSGVCSSPSVCPSTCLLSSPSHLPADSTLPTLARAVMASRFNESIDDVWIFSSDCRLDDALPKIGSKQCVVPGIYDATASNPAQWSSGRIEAEHRGRVRHA